jgi:eukaryotic-like serine/threonine-protein kinase
MEPSPLSHWHRVKALFFDAIAVEPVARASWIDQACGEDVDLRRDLQTLVQAHDSAGQFLQSPALAEPAVAHAIAAATTMSEPDRPAPDRCGAYRILREFGRGGMGVVYLGARADDRFEKLVAIKVVSGLLLHPTVFRRFEEERRILALLDHPHIARLLDAGTTEHGTPYVVMEFVDGEPIDVYCSRHRLSIRDRLNLFSLVCGAVQYSHQHLVVHRDIKARNVLVTADGVPKLVDFGLAKLLEPGAIDGQATLTGFRALTPESASPEQLRGEPVTVLTDVYSLGVLLYRLLTDRSPYRGDMRTEPGIRRAICDEAPLRPSEAIASPDPVASGSHAPVPHQRRELLGDLDLITLKALHKDPERRYASVEQLSQDIQRHFDRLPILAAPDAWTYRWRKFAARHWMGVAAVAAVILALIAGGAATWWQARRAERRFNEVRRLAHTVMFDFHDAIATLPGSTPARRLLVTNALMYLDSLAREAGNDAGLQRELATAYSKMGDVLGWPSTPNLGDVHGALNAYRKAQAARDRLLVRQAGDADLLRDVSTTSQRMSRALLSVGEPGAGMDEALKATRIEERLAAVDQTQAQIFRLARSEANFGYVLYFNGRSLASIEQLQKAIARLGPLDASGWNHLEVRGRLAVAYSYLALVYRAGRPATGVPDLKLALEMQRKTVALDAPLAEAAATNTGLQRQVMNDIMNLGQALEALDDGPGATDQFRQGLAKAEQIARADSANLQGQADLAWASTVLGQRLARDGATDEAFALLDKASALLKTALAADPANNRTRANYAGYQEALADAHVTLGSRSALSHDQRVRHWREAKALFQDAYVFWKDIRDKGAGLGSDLVKPDALAREIAKCDAALADAGAL